MESRKERARKYPKRMADAGTLFTASRSPPSVSSAPVRGWISGVLQDHARSRPLGSDEESERISPISSPPPPPPPLSLRFSLVLPRSTIPVSTFLSLSLPRGEQQQQVSAGTFAETARDARGWKRRGQPGASREQGRIPPLYL